MFVTTDEGVIVVDPIGGGNNRNNPAALKAAIATVTERPVRYVVYSHGAADHGSGGEVFADTAEFVGHRNTLVELEAANDPRRPVPGIAFDEGLSLELGGKRVELHSAGLSPRDTYITVHYRNVLMAVDNIRFGSIAFSDLPSASAETFIAFVERLEADPSWDTLIYGHATGMRATGTRQETREYREYLQDLTAAIRAARAAGLPDNSDEMVAAVRAELAPRYGTLANFTNGLAANIRGVIRWWSLEG
jgi:glyoxylase-like metal-dependent hydrolase (beta-lactamase superfamily II)